MPPRHGISGARDLGEVRQPRACSQLNDCSAARLKRAAESVRYVSDQEPTRQLCCCPCLAGSASAVSAALVHLKLQRRGCPWQAVILRARGGGGSWRQPVPPDEGATECTDSPCAHGPRNACAARVKFLRSDAAADRQTSIEFAWQLHRSICRDARCICLWRIATAKRAPAAAPRRLLATWPLWRNAHAESFNRGAMPQRPGKCMCKALPACVAGELRAQVSVAPFTRESGYACEESRSRRLARQRCDADRRGRKAANLGGCTYCEGEWSQPAACRATPQAQ